MRTDKAESLSKNEVHFITFNYDRLLEKKLFYAVMHGYADADDVVKKDAIATLHSRIVHVHGALSGGWNGVEDYGGVHRVADEMNNSDFLTDNVKKAAQYAQGIKIIYENIEADGILKDVHDAFSRVKRVVFLGFGYEQRNVERLEVMRHLPNARPVDQPTFKAMSMSESAIKGSAMGLREAEKDTVRALFPGGYIKLDPDELDAVGFCRRYVQP